jgi:hypothetical protein
MMNAENMGRPGDMQAPRLWMLQFVTKFWCWIVNGELWMVNVWIVNGEWWIVNAPEPPF